MIVEESEQWLLNGLCEKCRKRNYCAKDCKRAATRRQREIIAFINEKTGFNNIMNIIHKGW